MSTRALRRARLLRGLVVCACGSGLGIGGHLLAGGHPQVSGPMLLLMALAAGACTLLSDRQWSLPRLLVALAAVQLGVHEAMGLQMSHAAAPAPAAIQLAGRLTHAGVPASATAGPGGWVMLAAHAAAALATAWLLRRAEALFWRVVQRLRPRPLWPTGTAPLDLSRPAPAPRAHTAVRRTLPLTGSLARRGPPTLAAA